MRNGNCNMGAVIKDNRKLLDNNGLLGKALLQANNIAAIYTVNEKARYANCNINVVNSTDAPISLTAWISRNKIPTDIDLIEIDMVIAPKATYLRTNIVLGHSETLFVKSNTTGVIVRLEGFENNPL